MPPSCQGLTLHCCGAPPCSDVAPPHVLQVLGNAKGVIAAVVSVMVFANPVTWRGVVGYAVTIFGVLLYSEVSSNACAGNTCCQQVVRLLSACHALCLQLCFPCPLPARSPAGFPLMPQSKKRFKYKPAVDLADVEAPAVKEGTEELLLGRRPGQPHQA